MGEEGPQGKKAVSGSQEGQKNGSGGTTKGRGALNTREAQIP